MMKENARRTVVCCTPLPEDWTWFVDELTAPDVQWLYFSAETKLPWQKLLKRPKLGNPIAAFRAVMTARRTGADVIFSMGPQVSFWVATWCSLFSVDIRHLCFWFNFPDLPGRLKTRILSPAYKQIEVIRIQSRMEIDLYHRLFDIPIDTMTFRYWCMKTPEIEPAEPLMPGAYLSAIGGNARDYETLLAACKLAPEIPMVWVVRPENVAGLDIPPQVRVVMNIPYAQAMNYLYHSRATVVPLKDSQTPCGHVTLVSAMFLKIPILITDSIGVVDYVFDGDNGLLCRPHDPADMARGMRTLMQDGELAHRLGKNGLRFAEKYCTDSHVEDEMREFLAKSGLTEPKAVYSTAGR